MDEGKKGAWKMRSDGAGPRRKAGSQGGALSKSDLIQPVFEMIALDTCLHTDSKESRTETERLWGYYNSHVGDDGHFESGRWWQMVILCVCLCIYTYTSIYNF